MGKPMKAREALSSALVRTIEGDPVIRCYSASQRADADDWAIELKYSDGSYATVRQLPKETGEE